MAKAVGGARHVGYQRQPFDVTNLAELAGRLEQLEKAQEAARAVALSDDPDYATAFSRLFAAVAPLNPRHAAEEIHKYERP